MSGVDAPCYAQWKPRLGAVKRISFWNQVAMMTLCKCANHGQRNRMFGCTVHFANLIRLLAVDAFASFSSTGT